MNGLLGRTVRLAGVAVGISLASTLFVTPEVLAAAAAQAGWLDSGWLYRRPVTVTNTLAQERTNQQVTVSLSAANFDFTRSSGKDIRFTDSDGTTLLSHWLDEYNTTSRLAWFVVRVPALPASAAKTIYMYYGNTNAPPGSSGAKTFAFYDGRSVIYPGTWWAACCRCGGESWIPDHRSVTRRLLMQRVGQPR